MLPTRIITAQLGGFPIKKRVKHFRSFCPTTFRNGLKTERHFVCALIIVKANNGQPARLLDNESSRIDFFFFKISCWRSESGQKDWASDWIGSVLDTTGLVLAIVNLNNCHAGRGETYCLDLCALAANTNRQEDLGQVASSSSSSFGAEIYLWKHFASTFLSHVATV